MEKYEFYCPLYDGMLEQYDCDEISYGAKTGRYVNDGLPFLVPIETAYEKRDICLNCEHNSENLKSKPSEKQLIAAVEGKDLNDETIHELVEMIQQAVKENQKRH